MSTVLESPYLARTLGPREAAIVAWLEAEKRPVVSIEDVAQAFPWPPASIRGVLGRLERKGWLRRTARGRYETVLAETGGFAPPNPWAALSTWRQAYYIAFQSAAYERNLTPDRPAVVQVAVPIGAKAPKAWAEVPIALIALRSFSTEGVATEERHGVTVRLAGEEQILIDAAALPGHVGGPPGLARIASRAVDKANWSQVVALAQQRPNGAAALRRLAAIVELLGLEVPAPLAAAADGADESYLYVGERRVHGASGPRLPRWRVVDNVGAERLRDELRR
jgi:predicted transcriptional regulator of viral defense system